MKLTPTFWRISDLCRELSISRTAFWKLRKDELSEFPKPHCIGETQLWKRDDVLAWMESRRAGAQ